MRDDICLQIFCSVLTRVQPYKHMETQANIIIALVVVVIGTSIWVYFDAQSLGMRKGLLKGVCDMNPGGWFFACLGLWIITFPAYLSKRSELKRLNSQPASPPPPPRVPMPNPDFDEYLRKLGKLKDEGLISEAEFNAKKKALLGV